MTRVFKMHRARHPSLRVRPLGGTKAARAGQGARPAEPGKRPEIGGPSGPEPTRYGDWERKGVCVDF